MFFSLLKEARNGVQPDVMQAGEDVFLDLWVGLFELLNQKFDFLPLPGVFRVCFPLRDPAGALDKG